MSQTELSTQTIKKRIDYIDLMKGICIILIILLHNCKGCKLWKLCQVCYASVSLEKQHNGNVSYLCRFTQCEYDFLKQLINK